MTEENQQPRVLKQFTPVKCPHCEKTFYVGTQTMMHNIVSTPTMEEVKQIKEKIIERLEEIEFANEQEKNQVFEYINREDTILDESDIENFVKQVAQEQIEIKQNNK